jgi:hypothetical protein
LDLHALEQMPPVHDVLHEPEPLQVYAPQPASGSVPAARFVHVPTLPVTLQARQGPVHEVLQHTPSTHCPDEHSTWLLQVWPFAFFATHATPLQYWLEAHPLTSGGHETLDPLQTSETESQLPAAGPHTVPAARNPSAGHATDVPLQDSAASHGPAAARHSVLVPANPSAGQPVVAPSHASATSHTPADARHSVPAG